MGESKFASSKVRYILNRVLATTSLKRLLKIALQETVLDFPAYKFSFYVRTANLSSIMLPRNQVFNLLRLEKDCSKDADETEMTRYVFSSL